jgi:hypothetical protein
MTWLLPALLPLADAIAVPPAAPLPLPPPPVAWLDTETAYVLLDPVALAFAAPPAPPAPVIP